MFTTEKFIDNVVKTAKEKTIKQLTLEFLERADNENPLRDKDISLGITGYLSAILTLEVSKYKRYGSAEFPRMLGSVHYKDDENITATVWYDYKNTRGYFTFNIDMDKE